MTITITFWGVYGAVAAVLLVLLFTVGRRAELGAWGYPDPTLGAMVVQLLALVWLLVGVSSCAARWLP